MKAVLFDLDGVITDTAKMHYLAWKEMAQKLGIEIDEEFNKELKGIDRRNSIEKILKYGKIELSEQEIKKNMEIKNNLYLKQLEKMTKKDILPGIAKLLDDLKRHQILISIASASMNAQIILEKLGLANKVDYIANPLEVKKGKPAPDIFLKAAQGVGVKIENCVGIEDSKAGLEAILNSGAQSVSIGIEDSTANLCLNSTNELTFELLKDTFLK